MPQPIASRVVTDACQITWQYNSQTLASWLSLRTKMADQFFRFTIPPALLESPIPWPGPYLFPGTAVQNQFPHYSPSPIVPLQFTNASPSTSTVSSSESSPKEQQNEQNRNRCPNWSDAETRFLLELWRDSFPITKRRNSAVWDSIANKLNSLLKDQGISRFRTGTQCKARIKYLQDEYKRVKDHNSRSGNNRETFEYYEEIDVVLGCKPNITPKSVLECGLAEDTSTEMGDSEDSPPLNGQADPDDSDAELEQEFAKNLKGKTKRAKKTSRGKAPVAEKLKALPDESNDLAQFLEKSQAKDHKLFERLAEKEAEQELKSQKLMFDTVKEIAKIFKADN